MQQININFITSMCEGGLLLRSVLNEEQNALLGETAVSHTHDWLASERLGWEDSSKAEW